MSRTPDIDRRTVLRGVAAGGAAVAGATLLSACGDDTETATPGTQSPTPTSAGSSSGAAGGDVLVATADVPEGGGVILDQQEVVVTQPTAGDFVAFSSICTHQGCPVAEIADGTINCPCHGSQFSIEDGSVVNGPATDPLPAVDVVVDGDSVVRA